MVSEVKIKYDRIQSIKTVFEDHGQRTQQLVQKLNAQLEILRGGAWTGANAQQFYREMDSEALAGLQRLVKAFQEANQTMAQVEGVLRAAEDEASAIFRKG